MDRKLIQDVFVRLCQDSRFYLSATSAAQLTAMTVGCHPLEVWMAMPSYDVMEEIAAGTHPAARRILQ